MKRKLIITFCLVVIGLILFPKNFEFHKLRERPSNVVIPDSIYDFVRNDVDEQDVLGISRECAKVTCKLLNYSINQDVLFENKVSKAHCVTYAKVCAALCNGVFVEYGIDAEAIPVVEYITINGVNINKLLMSVVPKKYERYFVDHDMVEIRLEGKLLWFIDPTEREFTGRERVYH